MKPKSTNRLIFPVASAAMLASHHAHAQTYYEGVASQTWNSSASWTSNSSAANASTAVPTASTDAVFHITSVTSTAAITMNLANNQAARSMTFRNTGAFTIGANSSTGSGTKTLTIHSGGITKNAGSAAVTIGNTDTRGIVSVLLGASQSWTNNSTTSLNVGTTFITGTNTSATLGLASRTLTLAGAGNFQIGAATTSNGVLTGTTSAALIKDGSGNLTIGGVNSGYLGTTTVNAGRLTVGGTLGGTTTIESGAINNAGIGGVGKQTLSSVEYKPGSIFEWSLASVLSETGRGTSYDAVNATTVAGSGAIFRVVLDGSTDFTSTFWDTAKTWADIFMTGDAGSPISIDSVFTATPEYFNASGALSALLSTDEGSFGFNGAELKWTPVPEPTSALAGLLLAAGLLRRKRGI